MNYPSDPLPISDEDINEFLMQEGLVDPDQQELTTQEQTNPTIYHYNNATAATSENVPRNRHLDFSPVNELLVHEISVPLANFESDSLTSEHRLNAHSSDSTSNNHNSCKLMKRKIHSGIEK